jgi:glycosyltransferase involved in cell wall biosynthesis
VPRVSIILPTFNRARFLPEALASIRAQTWTDWELIVVDDGSTDDTEAVVGASTRGIAAPVHYVKQANKGAYGARNTGLDHATGDYVAFFDSDDLWLPHHLARCAEALAANDDVDWVYGACRSIDAAGAVVQETTFVTPQGPRPFLALRTRSAGDLRIIDDPAIVECQLTHGLYAGLQNSVIRRRVFDGQRFWEDFRVVDDVMFLVRALVRGIRMAYLSDIHVVYRIHEGNSSGSAAGANRESLARIRRESIVGLERLEQQLALSSSQHRALRQALAKHYFWDLGYVCYWETGDVPGALAAFRRGLQLSPLDARMWKTFVACRARTMFGFTQTNRPSAIPGESPGRTTR